MINSKKLKKLSENLVELERIYGHLNSGGAVAIEVATSEGQSRITLTANIEDKAAYDLSCELSKAFEKYKNNIERQILSVVRP